MGEAGKPGAADTGRTEEPGCAEHAERTAHARDFARRLRELREGSGRSYGSLARRVGVSASTLHRYCSGATVPQEFAPVERLAKLCGCSGDALVDLHSAWVRADAERTLRVEAAAARGGRDLEPVPAPPLVPPPARTAAPPSDPTDPAVLATGPVRRPERSRVTRRAAYAGSAALVLAVSLVLLGTLEQPTAPATDRTRSEAVEPNGRAGTTASPSPVGPRPSASSPPGASAAPSVSVAAGRGGAARTDPRTGPSKGGGSAAGGGGRGGARGSDDVPFTVNVNQHVWDAGCDHAYLIDRAPSDVPPPPAAEGAAQWAGAIGALHGGQTLARITVQGKSDQAVVLHGLRVRTQARGTSVPRGDVYRMDTGCGGSLTPRRFEVDLDRSRPVARSVPGHDGNAPLPAVAFPYAVSQRDPEVLLVDARAVRCDCTWYLELEWSSGDRSGTTRIDDRGRPFRTTGVRGASVYAYDFPKRRWLPWAE
ncbi:helix-turn-helix domain-containing protein [Streptomyces sp. NPDC048057]|uniref:helix-turn-helix domain-containing protein n=1 Tax=Streptomyces sp. NPDC048057 TaxID=3155628 RepID=UPI0033E2DA00